MARKKIVVGITGGFGTGKSTVLHLLEELGAEIVDADRLAHEALEQGAEAFEAIARKFPEALNVSGNAMSREKLAAVVFRDPVRRRELEGIIHPYVFARVEEEILAAEGRIVAVEVPLLFETGFDRRCDAVVVVDASETAVKARSKEKGYSEEQAAARMKAQLALEEKKKKATFVINNSGNLDQTRREAEKLWKEIVSRCERSK